MRINSMKKGLMTLITVSLLVGLATPAIGSQGTPGGSPTLNEDEEATLVYVREEEKLARDVYLYLFDYWQHNVFAQIAVSEQNHMNAILVQLIKFGVPDPAFGNGEGEFSNPDLQDLYDALIAKGVLSLLDALEVGIIIEEMDIEDLLASINETSKLSLVKVYNNLLEGSLTHLDTFNYHISGLAE